MGNKRKRSAQDVQLGVSPPKKQQKSSSIPVVESEPTPASTAPFLDNPKGADLKREVQLYDLLSSEDGSERLIAANAIVSGLLGGDGVSESTLQRHLERRLFRGLASGRKGARLGFSVVLTEILGQLFGRKKLAEDKYTSLTFDKVLEFLVAKTKPDGDLSGQEEKDHFLGLLFGLQCFVRAKILSEDDETWDSILEKLLELSKKKPWIREECGWVIVEALEQMNQQQAERTLNRLCDSGLAISPEGVGIWLTARNQFPDMTFPVKPWGQSGNPLEHLKSLAKALKESSSTDGQKSNGQEAKQTGNWNPKLHFVWSIVLAQYAEAIQNKDHIMNSDFENFWKVAVDENLFSATASRERKFWGFLLFQKLFQDPSYVGLRESVFSRNLVRCLINNVQEKDRFLNRAADKSLNVLIRSVESNPQTLVSVLPGLIGGNGTYNFDKVTKTKTVERILGMVDESNAKAVIEILKEHALYLGSSDMKEAETRRQIFGDHVLGIIRRINVTDEFRNITWIKDIALRELAYVAYTQCLECQPSLSEKTRDLFRNRLMSAFGYLLSDLKGYFYPCDLLLSLTADGVTMDEKITEVKERAKSILDKLLKRSKKANDKDKAPLQALALLHSLVMFQLYNGESEAISILEELKLCYDKLVRHKVTGDSDLEGTEVLVELLLSFISKPSALLRKVTQLVFVAFIDGLTAEGLKLMTDVLESSESLRGQQELFDQDLDDEAQIDNDDDDGDEEEDEVDSDVEVVDVNLKNGRPSDDEDDEENDEEEEEDEGDSGDDDEGEEAKKLDEALAKALGTHRLDQDENAEVSDSDADMTDSEMMALDSKLVEIFSQRKNTPNKKQEQKDAKETIVNFKSRVLDLLDIYAKKQASNLIALGLLLPLLQLMRATKTKQLAEKAYSVILTFAKASKSAKKAETTAAPSSSDLLKLMKSIHAEASRDPSHMFAKAASTSSLLVASILFRGDKGSVKKIATVYRDSQVAWMEGEVKMQSAFFIEWVNWCQSHVNS